MPPYLSPGVYMEEVSSGSKPIEGVGTAVAAFVGFAEDGPVHQPTLVTNWTQFTSTFGSFVPGSYLAHAVFGYFLNGGGAAYIVRIGAPDGGSVSTVAQAEIVSADGTPALLVRAKEDGATGDELSVEIVDATESSEEGESFRLLVRRNDQIVETFDNVTLRRGPNGVATKVRAESKVIVVEERRSSQHATLARGISFALTGGTPAALGTTVEAKDYVGDASDRTGFGGLEAIDEVTMLAVPDLTAALEQGMIDVDGFKAVQMAMYAHCELMKDRVAILDPPPGMKAQDIKEWRTDVAGYDSKYAALYYPEIRVMDPSQGRLITVPPSGHIAGVWARNDTTRGVHKAPANEIIRGAVAVELKVTKTEQGLLNPLAINCIRSLGADGIRVWGARTLSSDPEWRYLNVRRLFNFVEKSIESGTSWVVFEPNDPKLWDSVRRTASGFLRRVWRDGALFGATAEQAFFVKCDEENNPPENRDAGILTVEIGIAPVKPAEFVVFRISQKAAGNGGEE